MRYYRSSLFTSSSWAFLIASLDLLIPSYATSEETQGKYKGIDWPQFRGIRRDGQTLETGWITEWPKEGLERLWKAKVGVGFSGISVVGDKAYTIGRKRDNDVVCCLSTETGEILWDHSYPEKNFDTNHEGGPASTPTVDDDRVYTLSREGRLFCLNAEDGTVVWDLKIPDLLTIQPHVFGYTSSPLVDGDTLIVDLGIVLCISKYTTDEVWHSEPYPPSYGSPLPFELEGRSLLLCFNEFGPVVLDRKSGAEIQKTRWETWSGVNAVTPVVSNNRFFISSGYKTGGAVYEIALEPFEAEVGSVTTAATQVSSASVSTSGEPNLIWRNKAMSNHINSSVLWEGYLYGFDEATFKCVDFINGEEKWVMEGFGKGSVILADGRLLILCERGELILARPTPEGFDGLAIDHVLGGRCWTAPTLSHGRIYCRNAKGEIVCLDVRPKTDS